ncbi:hypothetical protein U1Q18_026826 [Sarracenia purpurea var. burkii]
MNSAMNSAITKRSGQPRPRSGARGRPRSGTRGRAHGRIPTDGREASGDPDEGVLKGGALVGGEEGGDIGADTTVSLVSVVLEVAEALLGDPSLGELVFWIVRL